MLRFSSEDIMASPLKTPDRTPSVVPATHLNEDEGGLSTATSHEQHMNLEGSSDFLEDDQVKDNATVVNQDQEQATQTSKVHRPTTQDHGIRDKDTSKADDQTTQYATHLFHEIQTLQERLSQLEQEASNLPNDIYLSLVDDAKANVKVEDEDEERRLRKQIRRAHWVKKSVTKAEEQAQESEAERVNFSYQNSLFLRNVPTEYRVKNLDEDPPRDFASWREWALWRLDPREGRWSKPARAIRPSTSLRPVYSRKLGPPTQWDTSDSEEWSDGSTRSRDFDYFRSRLRGDFEWELDRLTAQRQRYLRHKERKKVKEDHEEQERDKKLAQQTLAEAGTSGGGQTQLQEGVPPAMVAKLNPVHWELFRALRHMPEESCYAIDILLEEPKLSHQTGGRYATPSTLNPDVQEKPGTSITGGWDGRAPLPERIRIHSKHLIMILARIHGSKLITEGHRENNSLVLLRPFRMLSHYEKQIRDWHARLVHDHSAPNSSSKDSNSKDSQPKYSTETSNSTSDLKDTDQPPDLQSKKDSTVEDKMDWSTSIEALDHLPCLLEFMDTYIIGKRNHLNDPTCSNIAFSDIWHLFKPGDFVISNDGKQAYQVINVSSPPHKGVDRFFYYYTSEKDDEKSRSHSDISIDCAYIHYDGKSFGPVSKRFEMKRFDGERLVTSLDIYPFRFYASGGLRGTAVKSRQDNDNAEEAIDTSIAQLKRKLIERGKMFVEVAGVKHMYYTGLTVDEPRDEVESQVVIDFEEAFASEGERKWRPELTAMMGLINNPEEGAAGALDCKAACCWGENVHDDRYVENERSKKFINDLMTEVNNGPQGRLPSATIYPRTLEESKDKIKEFTEDELLIMSHTVFGFVLRDRTWGELHMWHIGFSSSYALILKTAQLDLTHLEYIDSPDDENELDAEDEDSDGESGDKSAFGRLVLPPGHKKMVLSLISQHFRNKKQQNEQVDIVRGKGEAL